MEASITAINYLFLGVAILVVAITFVVLYLIYKNILINSIAETTVFKALGVPIFILKRTYLVIIISLINRLRSYHLLFHHPSLDPSWEYLYLYHSPMNLHYYLEFHSTILHCHGKYSPYSPYSSHSKHTYLCN
jgi:hypothetical protein